MLGTCGGSDESALPIHPTLSYMGVRGDTPKSSGAFFTHLFKLHFRTNSCRHCAGAGLPVGSLRLDLYTTVGKGRRPHTQVWCQDQGAFFTHYPVSSLDVAEWFCVFCSMFIRLLLSIVWCYLTHLGSCDLLGDGSAFDTRRAECLSSLANRCDSSPGFEIQAIRAGCTRTDVKKFNGGK